MSKLMSALIAAVFATVSINVLAAKHMAGEQPQAEAKTEKEEVKAGKEAEKKGDKAEAATEKEGEKGEMKSESKTEKK